MKPWEKYADAAPSAPTDGPWTQYAGNSSASGAAPQSVAPALAKPKNADSIADKILGLGEAGLSIATSIPASIAGNVYGIGKTLASGKYGTQAGIDVGAKAAEDLAGKLTYSPRTQAGKEDVAALGRGFDASRLAGLPVEGPMIARIPEAPRAAIVGGEQVAAGGRALAQGAREAAGNAVRPIGAAAVRGAANALPEVSPETLQLARQAHAYGFRIRPDQLYENKFGRMSGELASNVPLSGSAREFNQNVFNENLVRLIGGEGNKLTRRTFDQAMRKSGETIDEIASRHPLPVTQPFLAELRANGARQTPDVAGVIDGYIADIEKMAGAPPRLAGGGRTAQARVMPGIAFRRLNSQLSKQIRETSNGDLRAALSGLQDDLLEARAQSMTDADRAAYDVARRQYAIGKTLEPLVAKAPKGDISPAQLLGAVTASKSAKSLMARGAAGELGTLADIGQSFLKEPESSGTAERAAVLTALGGIGTGGAALGGPAGMAAALPPYLAASMYNRFGPRVTEQIINRPPAP